MTSDDTFELYDLEVTVEGDEKDFDGIMTI